ncbi:PH domain-containing protein [Streptomyces sp. NPDC002795]|uniref:PH domain-containing protein n=1 Tax=Streptomyces sp. NPDC002795 TaxID=3364665 RepID=UPI003693FCC8
MTFGSGGRDREPHDREDEWRRLDRKALIVAGEMLAGVAVGAAVPVTLGLSSTVPLAPLLLCVIGGAVLLIGGGLLVEALRLRHTTYRIGVERAVMHHGVFFTRRRSLPRERIRVVDLTAHPLQRALGLVTVRIGTGEQSAGTGATLVLNPVTRAEGERLRQELLRRPETCGGDARGKRLATFDPRWIRYAPVSFLTPLLAVTAGGAVMQVSDWFGIQLDVIDWIGDRFEKVRVVWMVLCLIGIALVAGAVGALALWTEVWWNHRLDRTPDGTLRVRRGLFTARSISLEEARLRGIDRVEPLGARLCGAARVDAVATGLTQSEKDHTSDNNTLLPAAPCDLADRVITEVLREPEPPTGIPLTSHPPAALRRRLRWALAAALVPVLVLTVLGALLTDVLLWIAAACALLGVPSALLHGRDLYRGLGHGLTGRYLVVRSGSLRRSTVALQRSEVIGWTVRRTPFQRRDGLVTVFATTAAGAGAYPARDVGESEGLAFANEAVPGLLAPFLEDVGERTDSGARWTGRQVPGTDGTLREKR